MATDKTEHRVLLLKEASDLSRATLLTLAELAEMMNRGAPRDHLLPAIELSIEKILLQERTITSIAMLEMPTPEYKA